MQAIVAHSGRNLLLNMQLVLDQNLDAWKKASARTEKDLVKGLLLIGCSCWVNTAVIE